MQSYHKPCVLYDSFCLSSIFSAYKIKAVPTPKFTAELFLSNILQFALIDLYSFGVLFMPNVHGITVRYWHNPSVLCSHVD